MAGRIPEDQIVAVREANPIERVVGDHVQLRTAGSRLVGLCPFHDEKTPSFRRRPARRGVPVVGGGRAAGSVSDWCRRTLRRRPSSPNAS